jgi:UDP-N-acetylglucosamine diphosphorylase/glucosamine-1-phosphate N-acetyltransferase
MRHVGLLRRGTKTLLEALAEKIPDATAISLWGRQGLAAVTNDSTRKAYNEKTTGTAFFVNARANPSETLLALVSRPGPFVALAEGQVVAGRFDEGLAKPGVLTGRDAVRLSKRVETLALPQEALFRGYWDLVEGNGLAIAEQARRFEDSLPLPRGVEVRGPPANIMLEPGVDIEGHVTLDARLGPIVVCKGASVESFSRVMGPCYVGPRTKLQSALVGGGTSIFESCKIGGQVENSLVMPYSNKAHHGYVGDSYVGSWVNLGAGSTFSNLKNTYGNVRLDLAGEKVDSGMVKLGPVVGDMAKVSIGAMVYAGRSVGAGSHISGVAESSVPSFSFYSPGRKIELRLESVIETQRRMMERRGLMLSRNEEALIRSVYAKTSGERRKAGVRKGRLS